MQQNKNQTRSNQNQYKGYPTFRAKGVVTNISKLKKQYENEKDKFCAEVDIGGILYHFPVCKNTRKNDVLVIRINVIKINNKNGEINATRE